MEAKMQAKAFFESMSSELKTIISDINDKKQIISNQDEHLFFDIEIEGEKKLNGKTISEAFVLTYNYIMAIIYRLSSEGDLANGLEFKEGEKTIFDEGILKEDKTKKKKAESTPVKSIIEELDDFI